MALLKKTIKFSNNICNEKAPFIPFNPLLFPEKFQFYISSVSNPLKYLCHIQTLFLKWQ